MIVQRLPQPLTDGEITRVLVHADPSTALGLRDRAILETGYSTGLRRMELIRLSIRLLKAVHTATHPAAGPAHPAAPPSAVADQSTI